MGCHRGRGAPATAADRRHQSEMGRDAPGDGPFPSLSPSPGDPAPSSHLQSSHTQCSAHHDRRSARARRHCRAALGQRGRRGGCWEPLAQALAGLLEREYTADEVQHVITKGWIMEKTSQLAAGSGLGWLFSVNFLKYARLAAVPRKIEWISAPDTIRNYSGDIIYARGEIALAKLPVAEMGGISASSAPNRRDNETMALPSLPSTPPPQTETKIQNTGYWNQWNLDAEPNTRLKRRR